jgi:hypothetical protein
MTARVEAPIAATHDVHWWLRAGLALLAASAALTGVWAAVLPTAFYSSFPGGGHAWVALLPPYNEHLVRDVGDLYLGFTVLLAWAAISLRPHLVVAALVSWEASALPHALFHLAHLGGLTPADAVAQMSALAGTALLPLVLLLALRRQPLPERVH